MKIAKIRVFKIRILHEIDKKKILYKEMSWFWKVFPFLYAILGWSSSCINASLCCGMELIRGFLNTFVVTCWGHFWVWCLSYLLLQTVVVSLNSLEIKFCFIPLWKKDNTPKFLNLRYLPHIFHLRQTLTLDGNIPTKLTLTLKLLHGSS